MSDLLVPLEPWVREILRCPACGSTLVDGAAVDESPELRCEGKTCALVYPVRNGIPVLLVDEAVRAGTV